MYEVLLNNIALQYLKTPLNKTSFTFPPFSVTHLAPSINFSSPKNLFYLEYKSKGLFYKSQRQKVQTIPKIGRCFQVLAAFIFITNDIELDYKHQKLYASAI